MPRFLPLILSAFALLPLSASAGSVFKTSPKTTYQLREGDIVFQGNAGPQSDAVRDATGSPYTHCGIVFKKGDEFMVIEAVQPVRSTPLDEFIDRSLPGTFHAMRLKAPINPAFLAKGRAWAARQAGLPYDVHFRWDDETLYCSEFVWKAYEKAGVQLCEKRAFRTYNLDAPAVKRIIDSRYGGIDKLPLDEPAVAPGDLSESTLLHEVPKLSKKH
jgi:hypothetical protein